MRIDQRGMGVHDGHTHAAQQIQVDPVQAADFATPVRLQGLPVQARRVPFPAKAVALLKALCKMRGIAVQLLRDATHIDAGAAQTAGAGLLGQRHPRAALRGHSRGAHAAAAATNDKKIKVVFRHAQVSRRARLARHDFNQLRPAALYDGAGACNG